MLGVLLAALAAALAWLWAVGAHSYWRRRGVRHDPPLPLFGNIARSFFMKKSMTELAVEAYWKYPEERLVGFYRGYRPELVIRDPEIAKRILTTDFMHFYRRGVNSHDKVIEPMLRNLFFADGDVWRLLRQRMTPAFSSGKLRAMFPLIVERAERLQARALEAARDCRELDARELMARFTTDFIGACAFGLDSDSLSDENSAFRRLGAKIFSPSKKVFITALLKPMFPEIFKYAKIQGAAERGILRLVRDILSQRNYRPSKRNDFIDLLLECRAKGPMVGESIEHFAVDGTPATVQLELDEELMAAQVFVFFAAGFETSSSATSFALHQLAHHPEEQRRAQREVDRVLAAHDGRLSYEAVKEMTYLDCVLKESMRMFPPLGFLIRRCSRPYKIPEMELTIEAGVRVIVPLQALHNDPQYFPSPERFMPERFLSKRDDSRARGLHLPFGAGPRACIGERLGQMQSLAGLAGVLARCAVSPGPSTRRNLSIDPKTSIVQSVRGGVPLVFTERDDYTR
ncbi:cytochrome P450 6a2 [Papilio machaon]|uniref:cytochrome P450 6a2 n=1 Tax=Papilio machaon TaxID=76193 RepID=UPI001E663902|nr:cytochrome P450 6a2 [Papilio machaon]XP_014371426.2 cytochrome P450 6a2 [Papilio machaon]XP_045538815.1 cytochrome P450 6a2 [Papilio machaon]